MILPFSQHLNKKPTYFVEKIMKAHPDYQTTGLLFNGDRSKEIYTVDNTILKNCEPKLHTIRADEKNRWKKGNKIHSVINNRSKKQFQFTPTFICKSTQRFSIEWLTFRFRVKIDGRILSHIEIERLAINDGFEDLKTFLEYFHQNFTGKIIHWTDLKY